MANDMFLKLMSLFDIPDIKIDSKVKDEKFEHNKHIESPSKHLSRYFSEEEWEILRDKKTINWTYSDDTWISKRNYLTRQEYIESVRDRGGILGYSDGIRYESLTDEVLGMCLFDIGDFNTPITWGSKRAQKTFKKWVKEYNIIESIYRRFVKIQYAVLAFYYACEDHCLGVRFTTINRYHMAVTLDDYLKVYYEPTTYKENHVVGIYTWLPQIIPYIRFQLIDILELMGRSYYDIPCISQTEPFNRWEDPILTLFNVVFAQFQKVLRAFNQKEVTPFNAMIIRDFLNETYPALIGVESETSTLFRYKNLFYHHNMMETILLMDYLAGTIRSFEFLMSRPDADDESAMHCQLVALYDLYQAIKTMVEQYKEIDQYIFNKPGELTWHRGLIYCTKYRNVSMDEYLKDKRSLFKKRVINPNGLYQNPATYWSTLFTDFERQIKDILK